MLCKDSKAPNFIAKNQDNIDISLDSFSGKTLILYFYPKDMTKGCTIEAKEFSNIIDDFIKNNSAVVGVSPDSIQTHIKFIEKENLKHMLISDTDNTIAKSYFVWGEKSMYGRKYMGIIRSTFVIKDGLILGAFYNVKSSNHADKILKFIENL